MFSAWPPAVRSPEYLRAGLHAPHRRCALDDAVGKMKSTDERQRVVSGGEHAPSFMRTERDRHEVRPRRDRLALRGVRDVYELLEAR